MESADSAESMTDHDKAHWARGVRTRLTTLWLQVMTGVRQGGRSGGKAVLRWGAWLLRLPFRLLWGWARDAWDAFQRKGYLLIATLVAAYVGWRVSLLDSVRLGLIIVITGGLLAIAGAFMVSWNNAGSRNLALATGTLGAAIVLFLIQLPFELRVTEQHDFISVELTLDRSRRIIRQWKYPDHSGWRIHAEINASEAVAQERPDLFAGDRDHLTADMVLFSLILYLASNEFDWQRQTRRFVGATFGTMVTWQRRSKRTECTVVGEPQLRRLLENATNTYAKAPLTLVFGDLCLPPHTNLSLTAQSLALENAFCRVQFLLEPSGVVSYMQPGTDGEVPTLDSGEAQLETRVFGLSATTTCAALRAQHPAMAKHRDWAASLVAGVHQWFEGEEASRR